VNKLTLFGLLLGLVIVVVYLLYAAARRRAPSLSSAANIAINSVGLAGSIRLIGCVLTEEFSAAATKFNAASWWSLSAEDAVFVAIGGLALGWVSIQGIWGGFAALVKPSGAPGASVPAAWWR
jgi:hypothetical protein